MANAGPTRTRAARVGGPQRSRLGVGSGRPSGSLRLRLRRARQRIEPTSVGPWFGASSAHLGEPRVRWSPESFTVQHRLRPNLRRECSRDATASAATSDGSQSRGFGHSPPDPVPAARPWEPLLSGDHTSTDLGPRARAQAGTRLHAAMNPSCPRARPVPARHRKPGLCPRRLAVAYRLRSDRLPSPAARPRVRYHIDIGPTAYAPRTTPQVGDADSMTHRCGVYSAVGPKCWRQIAQVFAPERSNRRPKYLKAASSKTLGRTAKRED